MNAVKHAQLSVRRWGGEIEDYYPIHAFIDSTKSLCADGRHRVFHNLWAVNEIVVPIFGHTIENADGRRVNVKGLCERDHLLPDYANRFIPTLGDFVSAMDEADTTRLHARIEAFHTDCALDPAASELMLSPLSVTGRIQSLLITHNSWFVNRVLPRIHPVSPRIVEFGLSPDDVFLPMRFEPWMDNGAGFPPSAGQLRKLRTGHRRRSFRAIGGDDSGRLPEHRENDHVSRSGGVDSVSESAR